MKRFHQKTLYMLAAGLIAGAFPLNASAAKLDLLVIGPIESGERGCKGVSSRKERLRRSYISRIKKAYTGVRPLSGARSLDAISGIHFGYKSYARDNFQLAREAGRRARADLVMIIDHEFKESLFGGRACHLSFRLMAATGSDPPVSALAKTKKNARKENRRKLSRALNELFNEKAGAVIAQVLARKGGARGQTRTARSGGGRPRLLVIGPMDGNRYYKTSTKKYRSILVNKVIPGIMGKFEVISGAAALAPLRNLPEAKGLDFSHFFYFDRLKENNYRLARKFGKALDTDFVVILARDAEKLSDGGSFYLSFVDVNDENVAYEGSAIRKRFTGRLKSFLREFVLRSRKGIERAVARRGGGQPEEVQVARLPKAERRRQEAERKRREVKERAELDRLRRERELARMEIETLRKERAQMAAERKKLEELRGRQSVGGGKTVADMRRRQPAAIFLRRPREGESTENPSVRLNAAVTSPVDIQKIEVFLNGVHQFKVGKRELKKGGSRQFELSNFIRAKLGANELKVVATTDAGVRSERIVRFIRKRPVGNIYAVVIGVNKYLNVPSLRYAVGDAKAFADFLTGHLGVPNKNVTMLLDEKVTLRSLRTTLGVTLRKAAGPKDTVIIYYAGHGGTEPDDQDRDGDGLEKYLLPHDADPEALFGTAMSMGGLQSVFRRIRSERLVFIADACYSGAVGGRTILSSRRATVSDQFMNRLSKGKGRIILSAAGANQVAQEDEKLGHGVFTYYLIKALKGAGDKDGDGYVTVDEAYDYVSRMVPKATGQSQTPVRKGTSVGQLYLGRVKAN